MSQSCAAGEITLAVHVRMRFEAGAATKSPLPGTVYPTSVYPTATLQPAYPGTVVEVVAADAPTAIVAERRTDERGDACFPLAPGAYWAFVPQDNTLISSSYRVEGLPDGRVVYAWAAVQVAAGRRAEATLRIVSQGA